MPGTQRKTTTPRKAQPKPKPAEPAVVVEVETEVDVDRVDLVEMFETEDQEPVPITFRGVDADIRRAYEGEDVLKFYSLVDKKDYLGAFQLIAGKEAGEALWKKVLQLHAPHAARTMNKVFELSTLSEGELVAPLPASFMGMAGAQPSQDSAATTS